MSARVQRRRRPPVSLYRFAAAALPIACLVLAGSPGSPASAAPGDLDPSVYPDGKVFDYDEGYLSATGQFSDIAVTGDKVVAAGETGLKRFNPHGSPDSAFSYENPEYYPVHAVAALPGGKLVVAGDTRSYYSPDIRGDFTVGRLEPNGSSDATFADGEGVELDFEHPDASARALAVDGDGRVVVVGVATSLDNGDVPARDFGIARLNPDGTLDPSFSGDGKRTLDVGDDVANDVAIQPNGKIIVAGSSSGDFGLARLNPDGSLDQTFSGDGIATAGFNGSSGDGGQALALQTDGRIVVAGGSAGQFAVARLMPSGSLDPSFSEDGRLTTDIGSEEPWNPQETAYDVALEGRLILVAGTGNGDFALARYGPGGSLDRSFSGDGRLTTDFGSEDIATAIALAPDGKIVAGGSTFVSDRYSSGWYGVLARYLVDNGPADSDADGVLDSSDQCPSVFQPSAADGCPEYERTLTLDVVKRRRYAYVKATFEGYYKQCLDETSVDIYRTRRGRTKVIRAEWIRQAGVGRKRLYAARVRKVRARFRAAVDEQVVSSFGRCSSATSNVIKLRHR
jgi:uncharacterized delta-60 repeat protein